MKKIGLFVYCFLLCILISSCAYHNEVFYENNDSRIILHRGLSYVGDYDKSAPENTIPAFNNAAKTNCFGIETDVQETKDGILVCFHDIDIKYRTNSNGLIQDYTYDELKKVKIDYGANIDKYDVNIPKLEDFLKICKDNNKRPFIDIKCVKHYDKLYELIHNYFNDDEYFVACSFEPACYESIKVFNKKCICGIDFDLNNYKTIFDKYSDDYNILFSFDKKINISKEIIDFFKENDRKLAAYIINSIDEYNMFDNEYGIDYIFTDRIW